MSIEDFQRHWKGEHARIARRLPGLRRYIQNHAVLRAGRPLLPYPGFDCLPELDFDTVEVMDNALSGNPVADEANRHEAGFLASEGQGAIVTTREVRIDGSPAPEDVKLMTFLRLHPGCARDSLLSALRETYAKGVAAASPIRHEQLIAISDVRSAYGPPTCDALDMIWFPNADDAVQFLSSATAFTAISCLAGRAFGTERVIVRALQIL